MSPSQVEDESSDSDEIVIVIDQYINAPVVTATKRVQPKTTEGAAIVSQAPAIITVITQREIQAFSSVAEALETIPGLAINTDHVYHNVGVRGISGGLRGGSRHLKLLVNGQPVAFQPDASNFLGLECIPMEVIDRIEVIRGPSSALYGRNAFLGVVNIITKTPKKDQPGYGAVATKMGLRARGTSGSVQGEGLVLHRLGDLSATLGAVVGAGELSGLSLPSNSANLSLDYPNDSTSASDTTVPYSLFGRFEYELGQAGTLSLQGGLQNLDAMGEFLDYGPLSHRTRIHLRNWYTQLSHSFRLGRFGATTSVAYNGSGDGQNTIIQPMINGAPTSQLVRWNLGQHALDLSVEGGLDLFSKSSAFVGGEYSYDVEAIRQNIFVSPASDAQLEGPSFGDQTFSNAAVHAQILLGEIPYVQLAGNIRYDYHNVFGGSFNYRAAAVVTPLKSFTVKLLSSTSYRTPTAEQLYGTPIKPGDAVGALSSNVPQDLSAQTARSQEASIGYAGKSFRFDVNGYFTQVFDRIEYLLVNGNLQPSNRADSNTLGVEASARVHVEMAKKKADLYLSGSFAYEKTEIEVSEEQAALITPREKSILEINEIYPPWMWKLAADLDLPGLYLNFRVWMSVYARRLESQLNQQIARPLNDSPLRELDVSVPVNILVSTKDLKLWGERETRIQLVGNDLFNTKGPEPGFNGINIPSLGRRVMLTLRQDL